MPLARVVLYWVKARKEIEKKNTFQSGDQVGRDSSFFHRGWVTGAFGARCFILGKGAQRNREKKNTFQSGVQVGGGSSFFHRGRVRGVT